jgi:hypothetical protein
MWEKRNTHPMLPMEFFKNRRFSVGATTITFTFFCMFGLFFVLTQYLQFVLGYTPLETGIRMLPFAGTMMVIAPSCAKIVERIGTKITVATGMLLVRAGLVSMATLQVDTGYGGVVWRLMMMAAGMGLVMAPATESVMGSLPLAKAGVGSAVNDTTRQVGGALGVAIIGSVLTSIYSTKIGDFFAGPAGQAAPPEAVEAATSSLGGAFKVAENLATQPIDGAAAASANLVSTANQAFVDAMHAGVLVAGAVTFVGAIMAILFLPARASQTDHDAQVHEYLDEHAAEPAAVSAERDAVVTTSAMSAVAEPPSASS